MSGTPNPSISESKEFIPAGVRATNGDYCTMWKTSYEPSAVFLSYNLRDYRLVI